jgi:hypothetical protein
MWQRVNSLRDAKATSKMFICGGPATACGANNTTIRRTAAAIPIMHNKRKRGHSRIEEAEPDLTVPTEFIFVHLPAIHDGVGRGAGLPMGSVRDTAIIQMMLIKRPTGMK